MPKNSHYFDLKKKKEMKIENLKSTSLEHKIEQERIFFNLFPFKYF